MDGLLVEVLGSIYKLLGLQRKSEGQNLVHGLFKTTVVERAETAFAPWTAPSVSESHLAITQQM